MKKFEELNVRNSTIIKWEGKELRTTQDPYCDNYYCMVDGTIASFFAHAVDADNNEYKIRWEIINHETTDQSETCDWENPVDVDKL